MVFQYFKFCGSKEGGSLSLERAKSKMGNKKFFNSCIKQILDKFSFIFTNDMVNIMKIVKEKGFGYFVCEYEKIAA